MLRLRVCKSSKIKNQHTMIKTLRHSILVLAAMCMVIACEDNAIPSDQLGTEGIEQGKVVYDTIKGMRDPMPKANPEDPDTITVEEAVRIGLELPSGTTSTQKYHVLGMVKGFYDANLNPDYGNLSPIIVNKLNNRQMICYRMLGIKGQKFTDVSQLQDGDVIVVCGQIQNRYGSPQLTQGCFLETSDNPASGYKPGPITVLKETFAEGFGKFVVDNKQTATEAIWQHVPAEGEKTGYIKATAEINGAIETAESWLVSPVMDLTNCKNGVNMTFSHYCFYKGENTAERDNLLRVMVSTDGTNWKQLPIAEEMWNARMDRKQFTSASLDLSGYVSATTQIAFAYKSTAETAMLWALQNLRIGEPEEE